MPMRQTGSARKKRDPPNLTDVGNKGRATGLTVDRRPLDENDMEILDNWYSSPAKKSESRSTRQSHGTLDSSEDMEVAESSGLGPEEILTGRKKSGRDGKSILPLARSRSPIKTNIGATPVRRGSSIGGLSPVRNQPHSASASAGPSTSHASAKRLLVFSTAEERPSSRKKSGLANGTPSRLTNGNIFDPPRSPDREDSPLQRDSDDDDDPVDLGNDDEPILPVSPSPEPEALDIPDAEDDYSAEDEEVEAQEIVPEEPAPTKGKPGRPKKNEASKANSKLKAKTTNAKIKPKATGRPAKPASRGGSKEPTDPKVAQRMRHQTPMEEDGVLHTRSGRNSYKPLAFWKGERPVFTEQTRFPDLKEIIRIDDVTPVKRKRVGRPRAADPGRKKQKRDFTVFEEDADNDYEEEWELEDGVISGLIRMWNPQLNAGDPEDEEEQLPKTTIKAKTGDTATWALPTETLTKAATEIAFAASRIQARPTLVNPGFSFTKTLSVPFFGSGVIELPPYGFKGVRNSRKFHFIFFVHYGKVAVDVASERFIITKGGMWQVPRGNSYRITNETDKPANIFFAQGREIESKPTAGPSLPPDEN